jgi:predicted DsbA family dithiol-disulfide isomerase
MAIEVAPGTVVVYTDIVCAWSTLSLHRFYTEREKAGLTDAVRVDHRLFLLEDLNRFPVPKKYLDAEFPVVGALAPDFGWKPWQGDPSTWPSSSLLANEAVHAAKAQSRAAAEELDMALRRAFFRDCRPITLLHEILDIAADCPAVDAEALQAALEDGRARGAMMADYREHHEEVQGSPHWFFADGSEVHNPGIELHWVGEAGAGFPVVDADDPAAMAALVRHAADQ